MGVDQATDPPGEARRAPAHGGCARGQGGRAQAPSADRHARPAARGGGASGRGAGPRRRRTDAAAGAQAVFPSFGDAGCQGPKMAAAMARTGAQALEIVRRCDRHRLVVLPKRWIIERTLGWISRNRRLARDFERHIRIAAAFVRAARIRLMLRRLVARPSAEIRPSRMGSEGGTQISLTGPSCVVRHLPRHCIRSRRADALRVGSAGGDRPRPIASRQRGDDGEVKPESPATGPQEAPQDPSRSTLHVLSHSFGG
jgi:transposase